MKHEFECGNQLHHLIHININTCLIYIKVLLIHKQLNLKFETEH